MDPLVWVVLLATALSGFFALAGASLRDYRRGQLEEALGKSRQGWMRRLDSQIRPLRLTASFGRALANLVLVVSLLHLLEGTDGGFTRAVIAMAIAGAIIAIFVVAIPHAWASYSAERIIAAVLPVLLAIRYILWPVIAVMMAMDTPIRRLSGAQPAEGGNGEHARQEVLDAASEGQAEGALDADETEMIASVIEFGERQAGEIMTPRTDIFALPAETPIDQAARQVVEAGHTRVPVYERNLDNIIGILYAKDLLRHVGQDSPPSLRQIVRRAYVVPETKPLDDLLREFKARKVHLAVVLDEYGGTAGLVTIEDVLEEIVGDISDEYDRAERALLNRLGDDSAEVDGRIRIDELNDEMGLEIPEQEEYDTVAGLVFSELGYIPAVGETLDTAGVRFTVLAADARKITRLRVERLAADSTEEGD